MSFFKDIIDILIKYYPMFIKGVGYTMLISLVGTLAGLLIGLVTGIIRTTPISKKKFVAFLQKLVNGIIAVYIEVFRGTPMMVQAMVIYWGYAFLTKNGSTPALIPAGMFIVSINTGAYMAEIVRGGIMAIDKGQFEGSYAVGMKHSQVMLHVILPQVIKNILPSVSNEFVINIKDTSVLNVIGVTELYFFASKTIATSYKVFQTYTIICIIYFILTFSITRLLRFAEKKLSHNKNYTVFGSQTDVSAEIHIEKEVHGDHV